MYTKFCLGNPKGSNHLRGVGTDGSIIFDWSFGKHSANVWTGLHLRLRYTGGGGVLKPSEFHKCNEFLKIGFPSKETLPCSSLGPEIRNIITLVSD
jgi:hypothetical protein